MPRVESKGLVSAACASTSCVRCAHHSSHLARKTSPGQVSVSARSGIYHQGNNNLYLVGPIDLFSDAGYEFHSGSANVDLNAGTAETVDKVEGHGPFGTIRADRLLIGERGNVLRFEGHVSLIIVPQKGS